MRVCTHFALPPVLPHGSGVVCCILAMIDYGTEKHGAVYLCFDGLERALVPLSNYNIVAVLHPMSYSHTPLTIMIFLG